MRYPYQKLVREYERWIKRERQNRLFLNEDQEIERLIQTPPLLSTTNAIGTSCRFYANWLARSGAHRVALGDPGGWQDLGRSREYIFLMNCIFLSLHDRAAEKSRGASVRDAVPNCLHEMLASPLDHALWLGQRLEKGRMDDSIYGWWHQHPSSYLTLALYRLLKDAGKAEFADLNLGVYKVLFDHWEDPAGLKRALAAAADHHVAAIRGNGEAVEMDIPPYDLFPVEIHAIYRVRKRLGLTTPALDHPLMLTPFGAPPAEETEVRDELLERAAARVSQVMPELLRITAPRKRRPPRPA